MSKILYLEKLLQVLDSLSPFNQAAAWDNVGLMVGDPGQEVRGILLALDPTEALLAECRTRNCNTIITHHPLIFHPLKNIRPDQPAGRLLATALQHRINIIACHTNLDQIVGGVSDLLARRLNLVNLQTLQATGPAAPDLASDHGVPPDRLLQAEPRDQLPDRGHKVQPDANHHETPPSPTPGMTSAPTPSATSYPPPRPGFGRIGELAKPVSGELFLTGLLTALELDAVPVAGPLPALVRRVAVCGGSGSDLVETAHQAGADLYVSAEIKHAAARWAEMHHFCLVDAGHYPSENPMMPQLAEILTRRLTAAGYPALPVEVSREQRNPFKLFRPLP